MQSIAPTAGPAADASSVCERPVALEKDVLRRRIYAPRAYPLVRNTAVIPIVHSECMTLASWFPLVWRRRETAVEFVAIRGLLDDQRAQLPAARIVLPLILHAYPFVFDPRRPIGLDASKMLDDAFADAPTDVGATITTVHHKLARATTSRFQMLDRFAQELILTTDIGQALVNLDAFESWPLKFEIDGRMVEVPNLLVIRPSTFDDGRLAPLLESYGMPCAQMLGLHRISLFRAGVLLGMAKAFFKQIREAETTEAQQAPHGAPADPLMLSLS